MATFNAPRMAVAKQDGTSKLQSTKYEKGVVRCFVERFNLSTINGGTALQVGDIVRVARLPKGAVFLKGELSTTVTLGSAQIAIGDADDVDRFRAAAVLTSTSAHEIFGVAAGRQYEMPAVTDILLTVSAAAAPNSDNWVEVRTYFVTED
jgi:hypothetical protein